MLSNVMRFISAILSTYMVLIIIRIFLTWFRGNVESRPVQILTSIVDPYLNIFRRITWLRAGAIDFSPVVGIMALGILTQVTSTIALKGSISLIELVLYIISAIWGLVSYVLIILAILMIVRLISTYISKGTSQIWFVLDNILNRVMAKILGIFTSKPVKFKNALIICSIIIIVFVFGVGFGINKIIEIIK